MAVHITSPAVRLDGSDDVAVQITDTAGSTRRLHLTEDDTLYHRLIDGVDAVWDSDAAQGAPMTLQRSAPWATPSAQPRIESDGPSAIHSA